MSCSRQMMRLRQNHRLAGAVPRPAPPPAFVPEFCISLSLDHGSNCRFPSGSPGWTEVSAPLCLNYISLEPKTGLCEATTPFRVVSCEVRRSQNEQPRRFVDRLASRLIRLSGQVFTDAASGWGSSHTLRDRPSRTGRHGRSPTGRRWHSRCHPGWGLRRAAPGERDQDGPGIVKLTLIMIFFAEANTQCQPVRRT
jgi:hypothetical protein